jgi:AAA15 family ATPase/GTPase
MVVALALIGAPGSCKTSVLEALATLHDIEALPEEAQRCVS